MAGERDELEALLEENAALRRRISELQSREHAADARFLQSLLGALPAFVIRAGPELEIRFLNRYAAGFSPADALGKSIFDFLDPGQRSEHEQGVRAVLETGVPQRYQVRGMGDHGKLVDYETIIAPVTESDGRRGLVFVAFDVTEQAARQRALEQSQASLALAVEATGIGLWSWDAASGKLEWSERMHEIMGRAEPLDPDRYVQTAVHADDRAKVRAAMDKMNAGEASRWISHRIVREDGEVRWIIPCVSVKHDGAGNRRLIGGNLDVTQIHALEERVRQAERMESLGTLTAGVAHNFNNLLAVIRASLDLIARQMTDDVRAAHMDAVHATDRAAEVVRQLMTFAGKRRAAEHEPRALPDLASAAVRLCRRSFGLAVPIDFDAGHELPLVSCDPTELEQVLVNLLINARDAVLEARPSQPKIGVRVDIAEQVADVPSAKRGPARGRFARVSVSDNGAGMGEVVQKRVFDPFFSTKAPGRGTGLGLAMSWAVVRSLGGTIACDSLPGRGTTFRVYLPLADVRRKELEATPLTELVGTPLSVLLVDDDEFVRRVIRRVLQHACHVTVEAASATEALQLVARRPAIDVVLLDQSLPDARGIQIVPALRESLPGVKIYLFTGDDVPDEELCLVEGLLSKPLSAERLLGTLAALRSVSRAPS
jgi:two-component system cell cycle sensor histidine kinase/response regulator CckA